MRKGLLQRRAGEPSQLPGATTKGLHSIRESSAPKRDEQGGLLGFTKVVRVQTERKRLEDDLKLHAEQLADLHRRKDENPILHQARTIIERQVGQMSRLVDDLLEVTRITSGRVQVRPELLQVSNIVECAVELRGVRTKRMYSQATPTESYPTQDGSVVLTVHLAIFPCPTA